MAWPVDVSDGQVILASHINAIKNSVAVWPGDVNPNGYNFSGNVGIGGTGPAYRPLAVAGPNLGYASAASGAAHASFGRGVGQVDYAILMGFDASGGQPYGWIQAAKPGTGYRILMLNPNGGHVIQGVPAAGLADWGSLSLNSMAMFLNEAGNQLIMHVKYSTGAVKTGIVALT